MAIVNLTPRSVSTADALRVLDDLRKAVESGQVVAFAAVGIEPDDVTRAWMSSTVKVSRLRMMGAIANLEYQFHADGEGWA